jgi:hypothetical protein
MRCIQNGFDWQQRVCNGFSSSNIVEYHKIGIETNAVWSPPLPPPPTHHILASNWLPISCTEKKYRDFNQLCNKLSVSALYAQSLYQQLLQNIIHLKHTSVSPYLLTDLLISIRPSFLTFNVPSTLTFHNLTFTTSALPLNASITPFSFKPFNLQGGPQPKSSALSITHLYSTCSLISVTRLLHSRNKC